MTTDPSTAWVISRDGVAIAVHDLGGPDDPDAPVILFAHATGFHGRCWAPMAARLNDRFRCWAPDLRGHGLSELPEGASLAWSNMGDDLEALWTNGLLDARRPVHAVGHSMGGAAVVLAAARAGVAIGSLWLYEPIIVPPHVPFGGGEPNPMSEAALRRRDSFASFEAAFENFASKPPLNQLSADALWEYVHGGFALRADGSVTLRCRPATEAQVFREAAGNTAWSLLGELSQPTLIARGRQEPGPGMLTAHLIDPLTDGHLLVRDHLGHFGPLEEPASMSLDVRDWIDGPASVTFAS